MSHGAKKGAGLDEGQPVTVPLTTAKPDIARRIERNRQKAAHRRRKRLLTTIGVLWCATLVAGALTYYLYTRPPTPTPGIAAGKESGFQLDGQTVSDDYVVTRAFIGTKADPTYTIRIYDFDAHRFLQGKDLVENRDPVESKDNSETLRQIFQKEQPQFQSAWIVIFAGASFEGNPDDNRTLCRRRVNAIAKIMSKDAGITGKGYWAIAAGEFKGTTPDDGDEEAAEEVKAKQMGKEKLAAQRRLIVIAVTPKAGIGDEPAQEQLNNVIKSIRGQGLLPTNYDHGQADPSSITVTP